MVRINGSEGVRRKRCVRESGERGREEELERKMEEVGREGESQREREREREVR